ncbi:PucR family transcriptional regulator [Paenibacillus sanfengchensis]|uniref:PucR family transcriptional regulator n=1 Tax=Paenibacillus sanfengchensis TaxID=3119819 RepID=UPI002FDF8F16
MTNMNLLKQQIEQILGAPLQLTEMELQAWNEMTVASGQPHSGVIRNNGKWLGRWSSGLSTVQVFEVEIAELSEREIQLIELLLTYAHNGQESKPSGPSRREDEARSVEMGDWLQDQIDRGELECPVPDHMSLKTHLQGTMLPFLLSVEHSSGDGIQFAKLNKLLRSYFGGEIVLLPIKEDWLILVNEAILQDFREESEPTQEAERDMLDALCQGLYELITNEWVGGGLQLAAGDPFTGDRHMAAVAVSLRETLQLGRVFYVTEHIYFPWKLRLERLIYSIPDNQRVQFVEEIGRQSELLKDEETRKTLQTFFQLDCNVSETAKRLYIHRNTLLYRIDKFKQETGLDVRSFQDAVLVKLGLLLYKLTKRA